MYTHLGKIYWPEKGYTKGDMIAYYAKIAPYLLPYTKDRPTAVNRFPDGIYGEHFFQKNMGNIRLPKYVETVSIRAKTTGKNVRYTLVNNKETLLWLANFGAIELHPFGSRKGSLLKPDFIIFDLDPGPKSSFGMVIKVAQRIHEVLDSRNVPSFVKTSGKRGLHVYVPTHGKYTYEKARAFAKEIAEEIVSDLPNIASIEHWPKDRKDKVFIDVMRNALGQTAVAPYCLRPTPDATVSTPLEWNEVRVGLNPKKFTVKTIFSRIRARGDSWRALLK